MKKYVKIIVIIVSVLLAIGLLVGGFCLWLYKAEIPRGEMTETTVGDGKTLKVGVISDTQLKPGSGENTYSEHLRAALKQLKEQNVEVIIHAGDFGDMNSFYSYAKYNEIFESVFGEDASKQPEKVYVMGNHDMWWNSDYNTATPKHRKFYTMIGENPYAHKVINGFHFITVSPDMGSTVEAYDDETLAWLDAELQKAQKDTPDMPIFVVTHHNPKDTVYGSDSWCDPNLDSVLRKYSNAVSVSGHSHYAILDERSIYQNQYTAFTTQSLAYIENEKGKFDAFKHGIASVPPRDEDYPMMLIMDVGTDKTEIHRWNITDNKEEKANMLWTLTYPLNKDSFTYSLAQREAVNKAPSMAASKTVTYNPAVPSHLYSVRDGEDTLPGITFKAGTDDDLVHSYRVKLRGAKEMTYDYFSDFYNGIDNMKTTVNLALDSTLPAGEYEVWVYAIDSLGTVSEDFAYGKITIER